MVTGWSEGARRLLGHRAPEAVGRAATDLLLGEGAAGATGLFLTGSREWRGTAALRHRDGHRVETALHAQPSLARDGTAHSFVVALSLSLSPGPDRSMLEWAFDQASIALSIHSVTSGSWRRNATAESGERGAGTEGEVRPVG
ncbi:PAS sensor protein, partial [Streptomyces sp. NPDC050759]